MKRHYKTAIAFALFATPVFADDPRAQLELTQAALNTCRQQTADANAQAQAYIAPLIVENAVLKRRVAELEAKEPKK